MVLGFLILYLLELSLRIEGRDTSLLLFSADHPGSTLTHYLRMIQKKSVLLSVSLIGGYITFDKDEYHWALIG
jgi:hypothetical protein